MLGAVTPTLDVVPGPHPCAAVRAALELEGIGYDQVAFLPVVHRCRAGCATARGSWRGPRRA
jgi:hypothetical protein